MNYIKINGTEYPVIYAQILGMDKNFAGRASRVMTLEMEHDEAAELFTDGAAWSFIVETGDSRIETDCSDYCLAGAITDNRNGTVTVRMGRHTEKENAAAHIQKVLPYMEDADAVEVIDYFPAWADGTDYGADFRVQDGMRLWRCLQAHRSQADWRPADTPSLWTEVHKPGQGTHDDPIVYNNNMALTEGLYYTQGGVLYVCTRSTGVPVYNDLADLVGIYVEVAA